MINGAPDLRRKLTDPELPCVQDSSLRMNTRVWTDTLLSHTEQQQQQQLLEGDQQQATTAGSSNSSSRLGSWDYSMPGRSLKARSRIKNTSSRDNKLKEHHQQRVRFNARHPFHRRQKGGGSGALATASVGGDSEELGWTLDQDGLTSAAAAGRLPPAVSGGGANSGSAASTSAGRGGSDGHPLPSPASVGPFTPRPGGPDSVRNAAGDSALAHPSPAPPLSNGPPTPFDALLMHPKTPGTPAGGGGDQGGPRSQAPSSVPPPSPYHHHHRPGSRSGFSSVTGGPAGDVKVEGGESGVKTEEPPPPATAYEGPAAAAVAGTNERLAAGKRPALPAKDYEEEEEEQGERRPQSVYDYTLLHAWLSHPVKKFKGE